MNNTITTTRESTGHYKITYDGLFTRIPVVICNIVNPASVLCLYQIILINDTQCEILVFKYSDGSMINPQKLMVQLQ